MIDAEIIRAKARELADRLGFKPFEKRVYKEAIARIDETCVAVALAAHKELEAAEAERLSAYERGWDTAHEAAGCGHARVHWRDPKYGTSEYKGEEQCEVCVANKRADAAEAKLAKVREVLASFSYGSPETARKIAEICAR